MIVKEQKRIEFINDCNCIVDYEQLRNAIIWYQDKPTTRIKHIYIHQRYPAVSIHNKKVHIHRLLMMYWSKQKNISRDVYVHHKDKNRLNATRENLLFMDSKQHQSLHNKGRKNTENQILATIKSNHKRKGIKKGIIKPNISYAKIWELYEKGYSINKISQMLKYDWGQVKIRLKEIHDNPELLKVN